MSIRVAIIGPTGYTGYWLIHLLLRHPGAKITYLASHRDELPNIADEFPMLRGRCEMVCRPVDAKAIAGEADVAFLGLPHKAAMAYVPALLEAGLRVIDLSADYRLHDPALYEMVYQTPHDDKANLADAVYGLPEYFADDIRNADLVANPGCYPTAAVLAIAPLIQRSMVKTDGIIINAASGVTGAGKSPKPNLHFPEVNESYAAYGCGNHRHQPEIEQTLSTIKARPVTTLFVPHLLPIDRGILETIYMDPQDEDVSEAELFEAFDDAYGKGGFVRVVRDMPNVKNVRDTNFCDLTVRFAAGKVVVFSAIDNMIKGASGQAVQNMNLMFGLDAKAGLM
ncbi:MAG: N-acetyl-gamma-glutamyl-phosphate reductase [Planctomycetes bacterium]|nr:N-acetyl-gamma-glutamyl-phosphate reductase [Planctomycetota bacterium]